MPSSSLISAQRACFVGDGDARFGRRLGEAFDQARPAATRFDRESAPELELAVDLEGLPAVDRCEADAFAAHPLHRFLAARDKQLAQLRVGAVLRHPPHVVEELVLRVGAEVGVGDFLRRQIRHQRLEILDAVVDAAEGAGREAAVAAGLGFRRALQDEHRRAAFGCCQGRAEGRVAAADNNHVKRFSQHPTPYSGCVQSRPPAADQPGRVVGSLKCSTDFMGERLFVNFCTTMQNRLSHC